MKEKRLRKAGISRYPFSDRLFRIDRSFRSDKELSAKRLENVLSVSTPSRVVAYPRVYLQGGMQPRLVEGSEPPSPNLLAHLSQLPIVAPARSENGGSGSCGWGQRRKAGWIL